MDLVEARIKDIDTVKDGYGSRVLLLILFMFMLFILILLFILMFVRAVLGRIVLMLLVL